MSQRASVLQPLRTDNVPLRHQLRTSSQYGHVPMAERVVTSISSQMIQTDSIQPALMCLKMHPVQKGAYVLNWSGLEARRNTLQCLEQSQGVCAHSLIFFG